MTVEEAVTYLDSHPDEVVALRIYLGIGRAYIDSPTVIDHRPKQILVSATGQVTIAESIIAAAEWHQARAAERELEQATVEQLEGMLEEAARAGTILWFTVGFVPAATLQYEVKWHPFGSRFQDRLGATCKRHALLAAVREVRKLQTEQGGTP